MNYVIFYDKDCQPQVVVIESNPEKVKEKFGVKPGELVEVNGVQYKVVGYGLRDPRSSSREMALYGSQSVPGGKYVSPRLAQQIALEK